MADIDWGTVSFVVFDVDGTLYQQQPLRMRIGRDLALHCVLTRNMKAALVLSKYRHLREEAGNLRIVDFETRLVMATAAATDSTPDTVRAIISEWIEQRPLTYLPGCMYPGIRQLFAGLRRHAKCIGVLSDYPAREKLAAMGLCADHIVSANDEGIGVLKPHTRGLEKLIAAAKATVHDTIVIGDRTDRDGEVAKQLGVRCLIRSSKQISGYRTFRSYDDDLFAELL